MLYLQRFRWFFITEVFWITNSVVQSSSWEANSSSSKRFPKLYRKWKLMCSHGTATCSLQEPDKLSPCSLPTLQSHLFQNRFNISVPSIHRSSRCSLSFMFLCQNPVFVSVLLMWHKTTHIPLDWISNQYLRYTNHEAPYVIFFILVLLSPS